MKKERFSIALILPFRVFNSNYTWMDLQEAEMRSKDALKEHPDATGILIHGDHGTNKLVNRQPEKATR